MKISIWPFMPSVAEWKPALLPGPRASLRGLVTLWGWGLVLMHQLPSAPPPPPGTEPYKSGVHAGMMTASAIALKKAGQENLKGRGDICLALSILASDLQMQAREVRKGP